jgi:hypothetical protein
MYIHGENFHEKFPQPIHFEVVGSRIEETTDIAVCLPSISDNCVGLSK